MPRPRRGKRSGARASGASASGAIEEFGCKAPTQPQQFSRAEPQLEIPLEQRHERIDLGDVDGRRLVDAHEAVFAQLLQEVAKRSTQQITLIGGMDAHVIIVGLEAMNGGAVDHAQPVACGNQQSIAHAQLLSGDENGGSTMLGRVETVADATERPAEAFFVIRLQEVIDRAQIVGGERVGVMGGDEDKEWRCAGFELGRDLQAVQTRHLNIEKDDIRTVPHDRVGRGQAVCVFHQNLDVGLVAQPALQFRARGFLIVDDDGVDQPIVPLIGKETDAMTPPSV